MADIRRIVTIAPGGTVTTVKDLVSPGVNEVQSVTIGGSAGNFTLSFQGETTGNIAYNANAATVQTAITGLASVGSGNIACAGTLSGGMTFTFQNSLGSGSHPLITANIAGVTGGTGGTFTRTTTGESLGNTLTSVRGSFSVKPSARKTAWAASGNRYGGAVAAGETHDNGTIELIAQVRSVSSADDANSKLESLLGVLENAQRNYYFEWRPDGATNSVYYEIRGPATWELDYDWITYATTKTVSCKISIPIGPLARGALATQTLSSSTFPLHYTSLSAITGSAPALCDVSLRFSGGSFPTTLAPVWMLIGWAKRPTTPLASSVAPFGIIEAETMAGLSTWAAIGADTDYRGSNGVRATTSGAGTASGYIVVDPSTMEPDDFTSSTIDIEVWARTELDGDVSYPRMFLSAYPDAGTNFGGTRWSHEYASEGKLVLEPTGTSALFRPTKLGTITLPVDKDAPAKWRIKVDASWAIGSSGVFGLDYLVLVPARQSACSKTGVDNADPYYASFISSTSDTTKTIKSDLSGKIAAGAGNQVNDSGLGGAQILLPPGNVDFVFWPSSTVVDAYPHHGVEHARDWTGVTGTFTITPRYWTVR